MAQQLVALIGFSCEAEWNAVVEFDASSLWPIALRPSQDCPRDEFCGDQVQMGSALLPSWQFLVGTAQVSAATGEIAAGASETDRAIICWPLLGVAPGHSFRHSRSVGRPQW